MSAKSLRKLLRFKGQPSTRNIPGYAGFCRAWLDASRKQKPSPDDCRAGQAAKPSPQRIRA